jgi:mannitol/fructose-specific phosphotransferase system IIA component (Ntr-type)
MLLMDLLSEDLIEPSLSATTRDEALAELVDLLVSTGNLPSEARERALSAVVAREERQSTGLGSGVAIPHGTCGDVDEVVAALGIQRAGIPFQAIDGEPVQLVILLLVPPNLLQAHIRTLAGIARVLNDSSLREQLIASGSAQELLDLLIEREEARA